MSKLKKLLGAGILLSTLFLFTPSKVYAKSPEKNDEWKISLGASRSFPKLDAVNAEIKGIEKEVRQIAPSVKGFETWEDVYTGLFGLRAERKISENDKRNLWLGLTYAYGKGNVSTSDAPMTVYGVPASVNFNQEFKTSFIYLSLACESKKKILGMNPSIFAGPDLAFLKAKTDFSLKIPSALERTVSSVYDDKALGFYTGIALEKKGKINARLEFQYNWTKLKGDSVVKDSAVGVYNKPTSVDFTGPSALILVGKEF